MSDQHRESGAGEPTRIARLAAGRCGSAVGRRLEGAERRLPRPGEEAEARARRMCRMRVCVALLARRLGF